MPSRRLKACIFYCSNYLEPDQWADFCRGLETHALTAIGLPCSGKVDVPYLMKAFETGADGVVLVTCPKDQCRNFEGSPRAHKRAQAVEALVEEIGLGAGRIAVIEGASQRAEETFGQIRRFFDTLDRLPSTTPPSAAVRREESL